MIMYVNLIENVSHDNIGSSMCHPMYVEHGLLIRTYENDFEFYLFLWFGCTRVHWPTFWFRVHMLTSTPIPMLLSSRTIILQSMSHLPY